MERAISLNQQIEEVQRELKKRGEVYPRQVSRGAMRQSEASYHIARMEAVLGTLLWVERNVETIKHRLTA